MSTALALREATLDRYVDEITRHPLLNRDEEMALARRLRDEGDLRAAHQLVVSNLRFVVKIAHEYRGYGAKMLDLIQEGNIGLMHAVKKFDPERGYRLISYAVWWIRAHIQSFVLGSWSLVKVGSGRIKRKLFFKLRSEKSKMQQELQTDEKDVSDELAQRLGVAKADISEMELRMAGQDFSLDAPLQDSGEASHLDMLSEPENQEDVVANRQEHQLLKSALSATSEQLNDKERMILDRRLLNEEPATLAEMGRELGVSRERVRQLESRVIDKLRKALPQPAHA